jgi:glucan phosphoethanolaminetransferase (alkaline phosphatase superfamily)
MDSQQKQSIPFANKDFLYLFPQGILILLSKREFSERNISIWFWILTSLFFIMLFFTAKMLIEYKSKNKSDFSIRETIWLYFVSSIFTIIPVMMLLAVFKIVFFETHIITDFFKPFIELFKKVGKLILGIIIEILEWIRSFL